jgi:glycosyltransferase involved in cell wall biosynthesis
MGKLFGKTKMDQTVTEQSTQTANDAVAKKLLIVSSYRRPCGIAQYVEALEGPLRLQAGCEVEIVPLPVDIFRAQSNYARKAAKQQLAEIVQLARKADVVNLQLEPGLFGLTPFSIWRRIRAIIDASKRVIITYHTVPQIQSEKLSPDVRGLWNYIRSWRGNYVFDRLFRKIRSNPQKFRHIVQTHREARNFTLIGLPAETIYHQPLSFLSRQEREEVDAARIKMEVSERYNIEGKEILGCFGFLNEYKGIEVAVRAMKYLPENFHLLIVGGLHPEGISLHTIEQPYIKKLIDEIELKSAEEGAGADLIERVHFCGALGNREFNEVMAACDAIVLPYAEVGQTSSGPAAMALDLGRPIYCSRNQCFKELDRYQPGMLAFFEVGNHVELAEKIRRSDGTGKERVSARRAYSERYNVESRAALYLRAFANLAR